jgi:broad specificity phosphatase PhoE
MTTFYFIRHGEPDWIINEQYPLRGHGRDLPGLTERGKAQVYQTAQDERLRQAQLIVASPYTRAMQTAAILSKELQLDIEVEFDLREWQPDLTFQYDSLEELSRLGNEYDQHEGIYPTGETRRWESKAAVKERVDRVIKKYSGYSCVIMVGHGMAFRTQVAMEDIPHASILEYCR